MDKYGRVYSSRHVMFVEGEFPFKESMVTSSQAVDESTWAIAPLPVFVQSPSMVFVAPLAYEIVDIASTSSEGVSVLRQAYVLEMECLTKLTAVKVVESAGVAPIECVAGNEHSSFESISDAEAGETSGVVLNNIHLMVTRSKVAVFKPKIYVADLRANEPKNLHEAMMHP